MTLPVRNFDQITEDQKAAVQVAQPAFNLTPGSDVLAILEANSGLALFLQWLIYRVLKTTRLATCVGSDVDSFGADFLFARYPAVPATGQVLITRFTSPNQLIIPLNMVVRTNDNAVSFIVIPDTSNVAYNPNINGYLMDVGVQQLSVLVQAITPGTIGNVQANTITRWSSAIGIGKITNPAPFVNGADAESDDDYKYRFQLYINTRSRATKLAIENAIINTQVGLTYTIQENVDAAGNTLPGNILIYVDDGTGFPPPFLITTLQSNVDAVRPASVSFSLEPANCVPVNIQMNTSWQAGYNRNNFVGNISTAVINFINSLPVGASLYLTKLYQVIYDAAPQLQDVSALTINGSAADLAIKQNQVARFLTQIPAGTNIPASQMVID